MIVGAAIAMRYRPQRPMLRRVPHGHDGGRGAAHAGARRRRTALGIVYAARGVGIGVLVAVWNTTLQTQVGGEALGRVTAWDWMASLALWPAGLVLAGPLAQAFGVAATCWASALLGLVGVAVGAVRQGRVAAATGAVRSPPPPALRSRRAAAAAARLGAVPSVAQSGGGPSRS